MLRLLNEATPATADTGLVPESTAPGPGLVPIARVMLLVAAVTRLAPASRTSTWTAGVMVAPPVAFDGCTRNPTFAAGPTVMLKALEVAGVSPPVLAVRV